MWIRGSTHCSWNFLKSSAIVWNFNYPAVRAIIRFAYLSGFYALIASVIAVVAALGQAPIRLYIVFSYAFTLLLLALTVLTEAINSFINPVEASALAHQPIRGRTFFAAKFTYLMKVVTWVVLAVNLVPALAGLNLKEARWLYPLSHPGSIYLAGLFCGLMVSACMGFVIRFVPVRSQQSFH